VGCFWIPIADRQYKLLTAGSCCCAACRDLGFVNYNEKRSIAADMGAAFLRASSGTANLPDKTEML
jgi:hypothetical protein